MSDHPLGLDICHTAHDPFTRRVSPVSVFLSVPVVYCRYRVCYVVGSFGVWTDERTKNEERDRSPLRQRIGKF